MFSEWVPRGLMGCDHTTLLLPREMRPFHSSNRGLSLRKIFKLAIKEFEREKVKLKLVLVTQSCPTLCDPMDCSPPGSSVQGILQARILKWVASSLLQGIFPTQGSNASLLHCRQSLYHQSHHRKEIIKLCFPQMLLYIID